MLENVFIHLGTGKTGTSALQSFFVKNDEKLKEKGLYYLNTGRWKDGSHHLIPFSMDSNSYYYNLYESKSFEYFKKEILSELLEIPDKKSVLISSEVLLGLRKNSNFFDLIEVLNRYARRVVFIVYLRKQDELLESLYKQWVLGLNPNIKGLNFIEFINSYRGAFFHKILEDLKIFNNVDLLVKVYKKGNEKNLYKNFLEEVLSIDFDKSFSLPSKKNKNYSIGTLEFIYLDYLRLNNRFEDFERVKNKMNKNNTSDNKISFLNNQIIGIIKNKYDSSNKEVCKRYFKDGMNVLNIDFNSEYVNYEILLKNYKIMEKITSL